MQRDIAASDIKKSLCYATSAALPQHMCHAMSMQNGGYVKCQVRREREHFQVYTVIRATHIRLTRPLTDVSC
jgi:hypothetical protein